MHIFSKWHFLFSSLVMIKIIKTITKGIYSAAIKVCNEIELFLGGEVSSTSNRTATDSFNNHGLSSTRLQVFNTVNGHCNPETIQFDASNFSTKQRTVTIFTNNSYLPTKNIKRKPAAFTRKGDRVCKKRHNSDHFQVPVCSPFDNIPMTLQSKNLRNENRIQNTCSSKNATKISNIKIVNIASESPVYKMNSNDKTFVLKLKDRHIGKCRISENGPSNVTKPILTQSNTKSSLHAITSSQRSLDNKGCNIIQSNKEQVFEDKDYDFHLHTLKQNSTKKNRDLRLEVKNDDNMAKAENSAARLGSKKENNIKRKTYNFAEFDAQCTNTTTKDDFIKEQIGKDESFSFCKSQDFELKKTNTNFELIETNTSPFIKNDSLNTCIKPSSVMMDLTSPDFKDGENRIPSEHANNIEDRAVIYSPFVTECSRKDDVQYPANSVNDTTEDEVHSISKSKNSKQEKAIKNLNQETTNSFVFSANDNITAASSEDKKEASRKDAFGTATQVYLDYLKEIIPTIHEIESKLLNLCKAHYRKSTISLDEFCEINEEYEKLMDRSREVNIPTYDNLVIAYACEVQNIVKMLKEDVELSLNSKNRMKVSFCMEKLARSLGTSRNVIFDVNADSAKLGNRMEKPTATLKRLMCKKRK